MKSEKTKVRRRPDRGHYDQETINRILDRDFICQVGFVYDGYPVVIPTIYGRKGRLAVFSRGQCESHAENPGERSVGLGQRNNDRWARPGALGISPFTEL